MRCWQGRPTAVARGATGYRHFIISTGQVHTKLPRFQRSNTPPKQLTLGLNNFCPLSCRAPQTTELLHHGENTIACALSFQGLEQLHSHSSFPRVSASLRQALASRPAINANLLPLSLLPPITTRFTTAGLPRTPIRAAYISTHLSPLFSYFDIHTTSHWHHTCDPPTLLALCVPTAHDEQKASSAVFGRDDTLCGLAERIKKEKD